YDETTPQVWKVPLRDRIEPAVTVTAPRGGYVIPAAWASLVAPRLDAHAIAYQRIGCEQARGSRPCLASSDTPQAVEVFRASRFSFAPQPVEGHQRLSVDGAWASEQQS